MELNYTCNEPPYVIDSYTKNILGNPPLQPDIMLNDNWNYSWATYCANQIDYFHLRQASLKMAGDADFIFVGDDDFIFGAGAPRVINECCQYLLLNQSCGAILLGANFGGEGAKHGDEIYITNNGHLNVNRGIVLRNRDRLMDNRFHATGALEDSIINFTCLLDGYYICRRLHVPIEHSISRNTLSTQHSDMNYDMDFIKSQGIWSKVNKFIGPWQEQSIWPYGIWDKYRQAAMRNGRDIRYGLNGEIT